MMIDPLLKKIINLAAGKVLQAPWKRDLSHLGWTIKELQRRRFAFSYGKLDENQESAHFDAAAQEIVMDTSLKSQRPEFQAAILIHELQHAYDHFHNRPYTLESEARAFKAECLFLAPLDLHNMAASINNFYEYEWLDYLYAGRLAYLEGEEEFENFVSGYFVKSRLGHKFEGLETVGKLLLDSRRALEYKENQILKAKKNQGPHGPERRGILQTQAKTLQHLINLLERETGHNRRSHLPLTAPAP